MISQFVPTKRIVDLEKEIDKFYGEEKVEIRLLITNACLTAMLVELLDAAPVIQDLPVRRIESGEAPGIIMPVIEQEA